MGFTSEYLFWWNLGLFPGISDIGSTSKWWLNVGSTSFQRRINFNQSKTLFNHEFYIQTTHTIIYSKLYNDNIKLTMIVAGYKSLQVAILCPDNIFVAFCFATIFDFVHATFWNCEFPGFSEPVHCASGMVHGSNTPCNTVTSGLVYGTAPQK